MWGDVFQAIGQRLRRIQDIAQRIEDVPNFGPDVWTMRKLDEDASQMQEHCLWTGERLMALNYPGYRRVLRGIRERIRCIYSLAQEIKDVPNFGPDLWTMREVDRKCRKIKADTQWIEKRIIASMAAT